MCKGVQENFINGAAIMHRRGGHFCKCKKAFLFFFQCDTKRRNCCLLCFTDNTFHLAVQRLWYFYVSVKCSHSLSIRAIYIYIFIKNIYMYNTICILSGECWVTLVVHSSGRGGILFSLFPPPPWRVTPRVAHKRAPCVHARASLGAHTSSQEYAVPLSPNLLCLFPSFCHLKKESSQAL